MEECDPHHIRKRGSGRLDIRINLISLCRGPWFSCHDDAENGKIGPDDLLLIVAEREGVLQTKIRAEVDRLRRLPKGSDPGVILGEDHELPETEATHDGWIPIE